MTKKDNSFNPAALSVADAARLLTRVGGQPITDAMVRMDIDAGAPTNDDGTINLVHYAAWLVKQTSRRGGVGGGAAGGGRAD